MEFNLKIVKGGPFRIFENPVCCKISKKLKGGPLGDIKKIRKILESFRKKTRNENFEKVSFCRKSKKGRHQKKIKGGAVVPSGFVAYV